MPTYGVGTRVREVYIPEVTHGVTPGTPTTKVLRTISRNINLQKDILVSQETQSTGQIHDVRHGFNSVQGQLQCEWSLAAQDDMLEGLMGASWATNVLKVGTAITTYTFERQFLDLALYEVHKGVTVNSAEFRIQPDAIVSLNLNMLGMSAPTPSGTPLTVSPTAAPANQPFDSFTGTITEGGSSIAYVTGLTFSVNRGRMLAKVVGATTSPDVFEGTAIITGQITAMFPDHTLYTKFVAETFSACQVSLNDPTAPSKGYDVLLPKIKYTGNMKDPPREGPVIQTMPFPAVYDTTTQTTLQITRRP